MQLIRRQSYQGFRYEAVGTDIVWINFSIWVSDNELARNIAAVLGSKRVGSWQSSTIESRAPMLYFVQTRFELDKVEELLKEANILPAESVSSDR